jgi:hypothetical protein
VPHPGDGDRFAPLATLDIFLVPAWAQRNDGVAPTKQQTVVNTGTTSVGRDETHSSIGPRDASQGDSS